MTLKELIGALQELERMAQYGLGCDPETGIESVSYSLVVIPPDGGYQNSIKRKIIIQSKVDK